MGDFLSNLAARTLEDVDVLRPRPVSMFEPWGGAGVQPGEDGLAFETAGQEPSDVPLRHGSPVDHPAAPERPLRPARQAPPSPPLDAQSAPLVARPQYEPGTGEMLRPATTAVTAVHHYDRTEPSTAPLAEAINRVVAPEVRRPVQTGIHADEPPAQRVAVERSGPMLERIIERVVPEASSLPVKPRPADDRRSEQRTGAQMHPSSTAPVSVQPEVGRYVEPVPPAFAGPQAAPTPEPERTINVTIGRVEVRATPPPATLSSQRHKPPVMGLDEYLRRRSEGDSR